MNLKKLLTWSETEYKHLPWRKKRTLYRTLVSEIMLQQTTVSTVLARYDAFLEKFPKIEDLALASEEEVTKAWEGLGYYRRARNLLQACKEIVHFHKGRFPQKVEELVKIKGIGIYTANAISAIGRDQAALAVDANLERVISRLFCYKDEKGPKLQKRIQSEFEKGNIFNKVVSFRDLNEALMDLGRVYCKANSAACELCPLGGDCLARKKGLSLSLPTQKKEQKSKKYELSLARLILKKGNKILVYKKKKEEWLSGQWELPTFIINSEDKKLTQYKDAPKWLKLGDQKGVNSSITKYKVVNVPVELDSKFLSRLEKEFSDLQFVEYGESLHLSSASKKTLRLLKTSQS